MSFVPLYILVPLCFITSRFNIQLYVSVDEKLSDALYANDGLRVMGGGVHANEKAFMQETMSILASQSFKDKINMRATHKSIRQSHFILKTTFNFNKEYPTTILQ